MVAAEGKQTVWPAAENQGRILEPMIEAKTGKMEVTKRADGALFEKAGILISSGPRRSMHANLRW
jgi:hypothetical protein